MTKEKMCLILTLQDALFFFLSKQGKVRVVIDYHAINRAFEPNKFPILWRYDMSDPIEEAKVFSRFHLKHFPNHTSVKPDAAGKRTLSKKWNLFEFPFTPTRACNVPFRELMHGIFSAWIGGFQSVYTNDLLLQIKEKNSFLRHLEILHSSLSKHELFVLSKLVNVLLLMWAFSAWSLQSKVAMETRKDETLQPWPKTKYLTT